MLQKHSPAARGCVCGGGMLLRGRGPASATEGIAGCGRIDWAPPRIPREGEGGGVACAGESGRRRLEKPGGEGGPTASQSLHGCRMRHIVERTGASQGRVESKTRDPEGRGGEGQLCGARTLERRGLSRTISRWRARVFENTKLCFTKLRAIGRKSGDGWRDSHRQRYTHERSE